MFSRGTSLPAFRVGALGYLIALLLYVAATLAIAQALVPVPALSARVTDQTATLSATQKATLDAKLASLEQEKGAQLAVLIVATVQPETVSEYALRVAESWKLGRKGVDDGVLLLVAKEDRKLRIEVGYGLEGALNDATAKRIISETITPYFRQGDYFAGIEAGVDVMLRVIGGEPLPEPDSASFVDGEGFPPLMFGGFILVFFIGQILRGIFGRFLAAGMVSVTAFVVVGLVLSSLLTAFGVAVAVFFLSLFLGMNSGGLSSGTHRGGWGGGGGGGFGGGGGGGFSGGGGSFGGGGASGGW